MFRTKKEMALAMLDGKTVVFRSGDTGVFDEASPAGFVFSGRTGKKAKTYWAAYRTALIRTDWWEEIQPNRPVPCWVSQAYANKKDRVRLIVSKAVGITAFIDTNSESWLFATPVKGADLVG